MAISSLAARVAALALALVVVVALPRDGWSFGELRDLQKGLRDEALVIETAAGEHIQKLKFGAGDVAFEGFLDDLAAFLGHARSAADRARGKFPLAADHFTRVGDDLEKLGAALRAADRVDETRRILEEIRTTLFWGFRG